MMHPFLTVLPTDLPFAIMGGVELWIVLGVLVLLFGSRKLPELARSMGTSVTQFRKGLENTDEAGAKEEDEKSLPGS